MKQLKDIPNIQLKAIIEPYANIRKYATFCNYFRTFKKPEENVEDNCFFSPVFSSGDIIRMSEHYGDRIDAMNFILSCFNYEKYMLVYLSYDFSRAAVNDEYYTDGEFEYVKGIIEQALTGTNLYLFFMVSHFNQVGGRLLKAKPEHYHAVICRENGFNESDYYSSVKQFSDALKKNDFIAVCFDRF